MILFITLPLTTVHLRHPA